MANSRSTESAESAVCAKEVLSFADRARLRRKQREEEQKKKLEEQEAELRQLEKYPSFLEMRSELQRLRGEVSLLNEQLKTKDAELTEVKKSAQMSSLEGLLFDAARTGDSASVGHLLATRLIE